MIDDDSAARRAAARATPQLQFKHDPELPITSRREAILEALADGKCSSLPAIRDQARARSCRNTASNWVGAWRG